MEALRKSILAGSWYPEDPEILRSNIEKYIKNVPERELKGDIVGLIVPHAGYMYSGQVAAYAYKLIQGKRYDAVIIVLGRVIEPLSGLCPYIVKELLRRLWA